ncbi:MAG: S9 family peptidase [Planctomycetaceae bacterium]|nr:MAG: S9 family peptidase [Planctomycetaceae bacterium]
MSTRPILILIVLALFLPGRFLANLAPTPVFGQDGGEVANAPAKPIPPLSLESIYHPKQRHAYVAEAAPATRWILQSQLGEQAGAESDSSAVRLLIRRGGKWMAIDPAQAKRDGAPAETPWNGFEELVKQLVSLGGVERKQAESVVGGWVASGSRSLDSSLVRIENSLAIAGLDETPRWVSRQAAAWQDPTLSPDGSRIAFVQDNDLHVLEIESGRILRITDDGSPTRSNGRLDWVYQEEIYGRGNFKAFWWAPDSRRLALLRLDNSHVTQFTIATSDGPRGGVLVDRYPKAGDPLTHAELWVANLGDTGESRVTLLPVFTPPLADESLIVRVSWQTETGHLIFQHMNRLQSELTLWRFAPEASGGHQPTPILREQSEQWLEVTGSPRWLSGGDFLWLSDLPSGRRRLWRISGDGSRRSPLTPDGFDVRETVAVDQATQTAWLYGDSDRGTVGQHLYRVSIRPQGSVEERGAREDRAGGDQSPTSGGGAEPRLTRLTGDSPWHSVSISPNHRWMVDRSSGLTQPVRTTLRGMDPPGLGDATGAGFAKASGGWALHEEILRLPGEMLVPQWVSVPTLDGLELPGYVIRPSSGGAADGTSRRHPVLVEVYGGPLAPSVRDSWSTTRFLFHQLLASRGIGVMVVDNRSSGGRGLSDTWSIHRRVGEVETLDMIAATDWLRGQDWVNPDRLAIRGWSFGGFLTLHAMTHSDRFAAGVAGGSVTDWRNYDAIYTERYMGLPSDNAAGYDATSPVLAAKDLHGDLLLIHGEVDDNVHLANTLQMAAALQRLGTPFELMIYPGSAHGVQAGMPTYHLMRTTVDFLVRKLLPNEAVQP